MTIRRNAKTYFLGHDADKIVICLTKCKDGVWGGVATTFAGDDKVVAVLDKTTGHPMPKAAIGTLIELLGDEYYKKMNEDYDGTLQPRLDDTLEELEFLQRYVVEECAYLAAEIKARRK